MRYAIEIDQPEGRGPLIDVRDCPIGAFFVVELMDGRPGTWTPGDVVFRTDNTDGDPTFVNLSQPHGHSLWPVISCGITGYVIRPPARIVLRVEENG